MDAGKLKVELPTGGAAAAGDGKGVGGGGLSVVRRDAATGEPYLHLPMPRAEVVERVLGVVAELMGGMRR